MADTLRATTKSVNNFETSSAIPEPSSIEFPGIGAVGLLGYTLSSAGARSASTDFGVGLRSTLSQQIQPHRALLGGSRKPLEWHAINVPRNRAPVGPDHDLA